MRRPLRRLVILLGLLALLGAGWAAVGEAAARRGAAAAFDGTRERRRQAELLPADGVLWLYQRSYAPLRTALSGETSAGARTALPAVDPALAGLDIRGWYARPLAARWADYRGAAWRPIRLGTRATWLAVGLFVAGGIVRAAGRSIVKLPLVLFVPLRFLALLVFRPRLEPGTAHGSARWAPW